MSIRVEQSGQTISWFKDRLAEQCLVFKPPFQRNPVWANKHKSYLIDTVLRGLPIPEVYIQKETDEEGSTIYSIVDGQQRIRALLGFSRGDVELMEIYSPSRGGQTWEDLTAEEKRKFWNYRLFTREIQDSSDVELRDLFSRLNQHTVTLNAQELRNARFKGNFIGTVTELANQEFWTKCGIVGPNEIRRMLDIEFVAELFLGIMHGPQNKKSTLDGFFQAYEDDIPEKQRWLKRFEVARQITEQLVPDLRASRWSGKSDYYSLFLAADSAAQAGSLKPTKLKLAQSALERFDVAVSKHLSKEGSNARVSKETKAYAKAVEKAASDKDRRETRHKILLKLLSQFMC